MPRRKFREGQDLKKVLGVPALFSTAYGNVGSSIYYALGVVALYALGVTPVVFLLTGLLFCTTAWSYAEATAMVPEAGGSSSFGRRAFNEFVSFAAGWALMLDYIVTVAISAYFVPNYLAVFWPALKTFPYNSIGGILAILALVVLNVVGSLGAKLARVLVVRLQSDTFYGALELRTASGETVRVDSRPSDAIVLATKVKAPIFVEEKVLLEVQRGMEPDAGADDELDTGDESQ
jgi:amino acid transporter